MMTRIFALVLALLAPAAVWAEGAIVPNGAFYGAGIGGVDPSLDLSLNVGSKLVFDADATANDYLYTDIDGRLRVVIGGSSRAYWNAANMLMQDDYGHAFGNSADAWLEWDTDTTPDQLSLNNTNCDGGGADCVIWYTEVGSPDLFLGPTTDLAMPVGSKVFFDSDGTMNDYLYDVSDGNLYVYMGGVAVFNFSAARVTSRKNLLFLDTFGIEFGSGADQSLTYTDGTGVTWFDGSNTVVTVPDDTGTFNTNVGRNIAVRIIDVDDSPYTVVATDEVIIADTDSGTGAPDAITVNLPAAACGITIGGTEKSSCKTVRISNIGGTSNVTVDANASEEIDAATTQTVTPGGNLTLLDINQANYHWKIQ